MGALHSRWRCNGGRGRGFDRGSRCGRGRRRGRKQALGDEDGGGAESHPEGSPCCPDQAVHFGFFSTEADASGCPSIFRTSESSVCLLTKARFVPAGPRSKMTANRRLRPFLRCQGVRSVEGRPRPARQDVNAAQRERQAIRFERYLKSGSGRAFAKRHFARAHDE